MISEELSIDGIDFAIKAVCLAGDGRGQISFLSDSYSFDFETDLDIQNEYWNLGVSLPLYGEEILKLEYKNAYQREIKISGSFAQRIFNNTQKISKEYREILDVFLQEIALFIKFANKVNTQTHLCLDENKKGYCKLISGDVFNFNYSSTRLELAFEEKNYLSFHLIFSDANKGKFRRMRAYFENSKESEGKRNPIHLDLLVANCL